MTYHVERAAQYMRDVVAGVRPAAKWEKLAVKRQLADLARAQGDGWPWRFDPELASRPCEFIELLPHIKGQWARDRKLLSLEPWQCFILTTVFGWVHNVTGLRRFREAYIEVPRKNGKSALSSGVGLYMLAADGEEGAEIYSAATTRDQARIVFDDAKLMAERTPGLRTYCGVAIMQHCITVANTASKFSPLAAEGSTLDGLNVHCAVIDELHAHKTRAVYDVIDSARGARTQSLLWSITTSGSNRAGICYERRTHITKMLQGVIVDETTFGIVYTIDEKDDPLDPANWAKANPNWLVSVLRDDMEAAARKASAMPSAMAGFLTKRLDVWVSSDSAWMDMVAWEKCADPSLRRQDYEHLPCWIPLDLASKVDVAAAPILFYDREIDHYYLFSRFYLPERAIERSTNSQYEGWRLSKHLKVTEGDVTDFDVIEDDLRADVSTLNVEELPFDPWQATQLASHLLSEGAPMVEYRQTVQNMSEPMKTFEALVLQGKITHDDNPMMNWMLSNVVCHRDAKDNIYPRKEREENKIDGPVAVIMGFGRAIAVRVAENLDDFINEPISS
ncbi:terminase TerL endonuclease subunit [Variovorax sp. EBFNA2]|uniref:terminase large subunit n=1 Tax=Variovorax sp. EBFNA2 TaxID=3342097 RepID=UPI0029BFF852|nr:terminase TerL endonuclease subunit [Variovorax boronicumulans]WPG35142.1 terminase TerL endonuclease subunit [Variovorax boronicumulans]